MFLVGYQAQDLVLKPAFVAHAARARAAGGRLRRRAGARHRPAAGRGRRGPQRLRDPRGRADDRLARKHHLPNYNVFDEPRVFRPGPIAGPFRIGPLRIGTPICEDAWYPDVAETMAESGAEILMVPNGSPFRRGKFDVRMGHMVARVVETGLPLVYLNMVGGQDDQVFDGGSFVLNPGGALAVQLPVFEEAIAHVDFEAAPEGWRALAGALARIPDPIEQDYRAMVMALGDYLASPASRRRCSGFRAGSTARWSRRSRSTRSGPENVRCVMLPSEFTSRGEPRGRGGGGARVGLPARRALDRAGPRRRDGHAGAALRGRGRRT